MWTDEKENQLKALLKEKEIAKYNKEVLSILEKDINSGLYSGLQVDKTFLYSTLEYDSYPRLSGVQYTIKVGFGRELF